MNDNRRLKRYQLPIVWLISIFVLKPIEAVEYGYDRISIREGLSQSSVLAVCQDQQGFMWFGTQDGLNRYDGYEFKIWRWNPQEPNSLGSNIVYAIIEDSRQSGILWLATDNGIDRFDTRGNRFTHFSKMTDRTGELVKPRPNVLAQSPAGIILAGTENGLFRLDEENDRFIQVTLVDSGGSDLSEQPIEGLLNGPDESIWFISRSWVYSIDPDGIAECQVVNWTHGFPRPHIRAVVIDRQQVLWAGTENGLLVYHPAERSWVPAETRFSGLKNQFTGQVSALYEDQRGVLWIGSKKGLYTIGPDRKTIDLCQTLPNNDLDLPDEEIVTINQSRCGTVWVGTFSSGIIKIVASRPKFQLFRRNPANSQTLSDQTIWSIYEDQEGILWVGTRGGGLNRIDPTRTHYHHFRHDPQRNSISSDEVYDIFEDRDGILWLGTARGLNRFDRKNGKFTVYRHNPADSLSLAADEVRVITQDRAGDLWIGTPGGGLNRMNIQSVKFRHYQHDPRNPSSLSNNTVKSIHEDRFGDLWVGTDGGGLNRYRPETQDFRRYQFEATRAGGIASNFVLTLHEDHTGRLWIGTDYGLNLYDREKDSFIHFDQSDGLPNNLIYGILDDGSDRLWISTNYGLSRFDYVLKEFKNYDIKDGLQDNEFNLNACYRNQSGWMYFGGINGFNYFHPDSLIDNSFVPAVVLVDFQLFNESVHPGTHRDGRTLLTGDISALTTLTLRYDDRVFSLRFAALNYIHSEKNQYAYYLEGFDKEWIFCGNRRFATYTNLDAGEYTFHIRGSNDDGVWNENGNRLRIIITPPFWEKWWFKLILACSALLLAVAIYEVRLRTINRQKRLLSRLVKVKTSELELKNQQITQQKDELFNRSQQIKTLLDNTGQGFLSFGRDLLIEPEYSRECFDIFGHEIAGQDYLGLILMENMAQYSFLSDILRTIFAESNSQKIGLFMSLMPKEFFLSNRTIGVQYKLIDNPVKAGEKRMMVILTDITEKRRLENRIDRERETLKMVIKAVTNYTDLIDIINDYEAFCRQTLFEIYNYAVETERKIFEVFRYIHTFKGLFSQMNMVNIVRKLHRLESQIAKIHDRPEGEAFDDLKLLFEQTDLMSWLDEELVSLKATLGERFFDKRHVLSIEQEKINEIEEKMITLLTPDENRILLPAVRKLKYKPFKDFFNSVPGLIDRLAQKMNKSVNPLIIESDEILVDPTKYGPFAKSLVHVFRNCMDHGLESTQERTESGKSAMGTISCKIRQKGHHIYLTIADDGRGIEPEKIRLRAIEKRLYKIKELEQLGDDEVMRLIFLENFSLSEHVTELSGRGIGLSAVKTELDRLGGEVNIYSVPEQGTTFEFVLPYSRELEATTLTINHILNPVINRASSFFRDELGVSFEDQSQTIDSRERLPLKSITAMIKMSATLKGLFAISVDEQLARVLTQQMSFDQLSPEEEDVYIEDALAEIINTILGNSTADFPEIAGPISFGAPFTLKGGESILKHMGNEIWMAEISTDYGNMSISYLGSLDISFN